MWHTVEHLTSFSYDAPIVEAYTEVRLKPVHRNGQRCSAFRLSTEPQGATIDEYEDRFGNVVHHFDILEPHEQLTLVARSEVWTPARFEPDPGLEPPIDGWDFLQESRYVQLDGPVAELAASVPATGSADDLADGLMAAVRGAMAYVRGSTNVHTRAAEALEVGSGVCQDFAHVLIGVCRLRGLAARYVSGYLKDDALADGASASHAWVDVRTTHGWRSLDPTHDSEQSEQYVRVGTGRDYGDVTPTRGVWKGNATEALEVSVRIS